MSDWQKNFFIDNWARAFWKRDLNDVLLHFEGPRDVLLVGFDSEYGNNKSKNWRPWGADFAQENEINYLGVSTVVPNWYLSEWVNMQIQALVDKGFFDRFRRVVFAGHSMGAHGALRFSHYVPRSYVAAYSPQVTLQAARANFDTRFADASRLPWRDAATDVGNFSYNATRTLVLYDPYVPEDRAHAERLGTAGATLLRTYQAGHGSMAYLRKIGVGDEILQKICFDELTPREFYALFRHRRNTRWFQKALRTYYVQQGRDVMAERVDAAVTQANAKAGFSRFDPSAKAVP
jgi:hypothetical protein